MAKIIVVGSLNMDLVVRSAHLPAPGETILGGEFITVPGGKGANQAVAAARLGSQVTMVGRVGQDDFGLTLRQNLVREGIDVSHLETDPDASTGVALITVDQSGQNTIVVASGANMRLTPAEVERAFAQLTSFDMVVLQLESPLECVGTAARLGHQHGARVILNPAPARPLPASLLAMVDVLVPNETETGILTGFSIGRPAEVEIAGQQLLNLGVGGVVITLGGRGALAIPARKEPAFYLPAYPVKAVDTTAAGDAFIGGLATGLGEGLPLPEAVRLGNAAGAISVTRLGAQPSLPSRSEVTQFLKGAQ